MELIANCSAELPPVLADPKAIHQVLQNLCTHVGNALAGQPGRIMLRLDAITVDAAFVATHANLRPGYYARLAVSTPGKALDAATVDRIFKPFFTNKSIYNRRFSGIWTTYNGKPWKFIINFFRKVRFEMSQQFIQKFSCSQSVYGRNHKWFTQSEFVKFSRFILPFKCVCFI